MSGGLLPRLRRGWGDRAAERLSRLRVVQQRVDRQQGHHLLAVDRNIFPTNANIFKVVDCEKQNYAPEGEPLHQIVDEFADHQDIWFRVEDILLLLPFNNFYLVCLRIISLHLTKCWRTATVLTIWWRGHSSGLEQLVQKSMKTVEILFGDATLRINK